MLGVLVHAHMEFAIISQFHIIDLVFFRAFYKRVHEYHQLFDNMISMEIYVQTTCIQRLMVVMKLWNVKNQLNRICQISSETLMNMNTNLRLLLLNNIKFSEHFACI